MAVTLCRRQLQARAKIVSSTNFRAMTIAIVFTCLLAPGVVTAVTDSEGECDDGQSSQRALQVLDGTSGDEPYEQLVSNFAPQHPPLDPTEEWKEVLDGQPVPPGLEIRFDLENGKKFARLPPGVTLEAIQRSKEGVHVNTPGEDLKDLNDPILSRVSPNVVWGTDLDVEDTEELPLPDVENLTDSLKQLLLELPQPEPELLQGLQDKLGDEEMEEIYRRVWQKRQAEIRDAFKAARDEGKLVKQLLGVLVRGRIDYKKETLAAGLTMSSPAEQLSALVDLEYLVSDIDLAGDFFHFGGLNVIGDALKYGSTDNERKFLNTFAQDDQDDEQSIMDIAFDIRAKSAWVLGTAVKNQYKLQKSIAQSFVLPDVLDLILSGYSEGQLRSASKGLYCLGSILRHNPPAQKQFVAIGGMDKFQKMLLKIANITPTNLKDIGMLSLTSSCAHLDNQHKQFVTKALSIMSDLSENIAEDTRPTNHDMVQALSETIETWFAISLTVTQCATTIDEIEKGFDTVNGFTSLLPVSSHDVTHLTSTAVSVVNQTLASVERQVMEGVEAFVEYAVEVQEKGEDLLAKLII